MFGRTTSTHTVALLEVPKMVYDDIRKRLEDAGYQHAFDHHDGRNVIDMSGIALAEESPVAQCYDCARPYGDEHGFPDLVIPNEFWRRISPAGDEGGLLCPSCICKRLHDAGIREVYGSFMSGPIRSVDQPVMYALRWTENLREQQERVKPPPTPPVGHGRSVL